MWKTMFLTLVLLLSSVLLFTETVFANPWIEGNAWVADNTVNLVQPELPKAIVDESKSNKQPAESKTDNQNPAPEEQLTVNTVRPQVANPYNLEAIEKHNEAVYGAGN